ncbi:lytic murein transglycosylase [Variibacter gotjawalensis]|nr:lytic murein transglycosylase [Variibacter gotjawalensis]
MTAQAIRQSAASFPQCIEGLWPAAHKRGITRATFDANLRGVTPDLKIMDFMDAQPEFTKAFWEYLDVLVTESRIQKGREMLAQHRATFDKVERQYGVDRHIIAAIWGIESNYSTRMGDRPVVRSTATLACVGRRQEYFREELLAALEIINRGDVRADLMRGSWAGAFGPTQFMPTAFKRHAVDFDGDGHRNIIETPADLFASTSNMLKKSGWQTGQGWGYEVVVPQRFNYIMADRSKQLTIAQWEKMGLRRAGDRPFPNPNAKAYLTVPAGARGPGFLMAGNFLAIMKYNPSEAYALAIGHLADRLRGGGAFVQAWPQDEQVLSRSERLELQQRLVSRGFDAGSDGRLSHKTRMAVISYQASAGLTPDGFASGSLLQRLRGR